MIDEQKREMGIYTETETKTIEGVVYVRTEKTDIGKNHEVKRFERSYEPPIPSKINWNEH